MAGLAAVTSRIQLYASVAVLTIPPAIVARMTSTINSISGGRFGVNIVSGWAKGEYDQMGLWPGEEHYNKRYDYSTEYVTILRELWETGTSNFKGEYFQMEDCKLSPRPQAYVKVVCAGQSPRGIEFGAGYGDYNFVAAKGINTPTAHSATNAGDGRGRRQGRPRCRQLRAVHGDRRRDRRGGHGQVAALQRRRRPCRDGLAGRPGQC